MDAPMDPIAETVAYVAITRLQQAYGDVVTRNAWDEMPALFTPDAMLTYDIVPNVIEMTPQKMADFGATSNAEYELGELNNLNVVVEFQSPTEATGRVFSVEIRQNDTGWVPIYGLYLDRYVVHEDRWRFATRRYRTVARMQPLPKAEVVPFPDGL